MVMYAFDLNVVPMDEDEVVQQGLNLDNGNSFDQVLLPIKKRVLKDLYEDDYKVKEIVQPGFHISIPVKKRSYIREYHRDTSDQKHYKVEDTACFDLKTPSIKDSCSAAFIPAQKHRIIRFRISNKLNEQPDIKAPIETQALKVLYQDDVTVNLKGQEESMTNRVICEAPSQKRQRVEGTVCFNPTTAPIQNSAEAAFRPAQKRLKIKFRTNKSRIRSAGTKPAKKKIQINTGSQSFEPKSRSVIDATKLLPECIKNHPEFKDMTDVKLIIQKSLTVCDIDKHQDRLAIPSGKILTNFLTKLERTGLDREISKKCTEKGKSRKRKLGVKVIGPCSSTNDLKVHKLSLSQWNYKSNGFRYVLNSSWNDFMDEFKLQLGDFIQVVSFRCNRHLCMAILKPDFSSKTSTLTLLPAALPAWGQKRKRTLKVAL